MYKVRYITTSEVTAVRYVFDEKEIEAADDADAIAKFDAECTTPLDSSIAMDIVSGEGYDWAILKSVDLYDRLLCCARAAQGGSGASPTTTARYRSLRSLCARLAALHF